MPLLTELNSPETNNLEILIPYQLKNGLLGPEILSQLLPKMNFRAVRYIIKNHYRTAARVEFE